MGQELEKIRDIIRDSENIVLIGGSEMMREAGLNGTRAEHMTYEVEEKYGYSPEEILTSMFLSRQTKTFYNYMKEVMLNKVDVEPPDSFKAAAELEKSGKMTAIVTRMIYSLFKKAGCENVVELYGSAESNYCPAFGKKFTSKYIKEAKDIPSCDSCGVPIRPGFSLFGEMLDNGKLTKAVNAIEGANVLLVAGTSINSMTWANTLRYYSGDKLILINTEAKDGDEKANYRAYGNISEIFRYIADYKEA